MNAVIYARYTLGAQTNPSLETQLKACREFAKANHYTVIGEYVDANSPGVRDRHHEFKRIIEDSVKQEFQAVLVFQLDRLPRNMLEYFDIKATLQSNNVKIICMDEIVQDPILEGLLEHLADVFFSPSAQQVIEDKLKQVYAILDEVQEMLYNI